jgi:hypothetical protein
MLSLTPNECRVLGVLVEKAQTTPQQYPLTLNATVNGANQKNNRDPVTSLDEDAVLEALDGLRAKGLAREVALTGSRVPKFRHDAREQLKIETPELVILVELLLRGPQTLGELRGRASRMHDLGSLEAVDAMVRGLMSRPEPLVHELPPEPGSRAARFAQVLCPDLHPLHTTGSVGSTAREKVDSAMASHAELTDRLVRLEDEVAQLREMVRSLTSELGA